MQYDWFVFFKRAKTVALLELARGSEQDVCRELGAELLSEQPFPALDGILVAKKGEDFYYLVMTLLRDIRLASFITEDLDGCSIGQIITDKRQLLWLLTCEKYFRYIAREIVDGEEPTYLEDRLATSKGVVITVNQQTGELVLCYVDTTFAQMLKLKDYNLVSSHAGIFTFVRFGEDDVHSKIYYWVAYDVTEKRLNRFFTHWLTRESGWWNYNLVVSPELSEADYERLTHCPIWAMLEPRIHGDFRSKRTHECLVVAERLSQAIDLPPEKNQFLGVVVVHHDNAILYWNVAVLRYPEYLIIDQTLSDLFGYAAEQRYLSQFGRVPLEAEILRLTVELPGKKGSVRAGYLLEIDVE